MNWTIMQHGRRSSRPRICWCCFRVVLDRSELTFMDSSGLAVVLHLYRTCARSGREFAVRGTPPQPMRVFEAAGLPQVMVFERGKE